MLRAALIGFGSDRQNHPVSAHDQRPGGRPRGPRQGEATIGISKVPDQRLDRLTAMYNPRKRVPATVEFSDLATPVRAGSAQALVDVAAYKNADALVHVLRAFNDPAVPHPSGSMDPARDAQAMEDELILADLGVAERRLERLEKDLKKGKSAELERERDVVTLCRRRRSKRGGRFARSTCKGDDLKRLRGFQFLSAKPLLIVLNLDEQSLTAAATALQTPRKRGVEAVSLARRLPRRSPSARRSSSKSPSSTPPMPPRSWRIWG